ncbi:MAG: ComF family protein [Pedobacter sp.]|nr:MAG: ComF family protein [Pedobacter sp.]
MQQLKRLAADVIGLLFPNLCNGCGNMLYKGESVICAYCLSDLPYTDYHLHRENKVAKQLWGRLQFNAAMSMLYFKKEGKVQNLIHNLKYNGKSEVGYLLGTLLGEKLAISTDYKNIDGIVPVPLHPKRQRKRGYNQSEHIAEGIAAVLGVDVYPNVLIREKITDTQTRKSRFIRYENMSSVFAIADEQSLEEKHILLVDDVFTTGATFEACGTTLLAGGLKKLSIASVAFSS